VTLALAGDPRQLSRDIGFELVARAVVMMLLDRLNDELEAQEAHWAKADLEYQQATGGTVAQIELERFEPVNIQDGPHQSIVNAPPERFPFIGVMSYLTTPRAEQSDHFHENSLRLFLEAFTKVGPVPEGAELDHETILHRRIQRTTEAAHAVILSDPGLRGTVPDRIRNPPRGGIGNNAWIKYGGAEGHGARYMWQGSRLEYTLQRQSAVSS
jgi:hypothetical protein